MTTIEALARRLSRPVADVDEAFRERAAIREHLGNMSRAEAEKLAVGDVLSMLGGNDAR